MITAQFKLLNLLTCSKFNRNLVNMTEKTHLGNLVIQHKFGNKCPCCRREQQLGSQKFLHSMSKLSKKSQNSIQKYSKNIMNSSLILTPKNLFSQQCSVNEKFLSNSIQLSQNQFTYIKQLDRTKNIFPPNNKQSSEYNSTLSHLYNIINQDMNKKQQLLNSVLKSPQRNLYKIVEECIIVLQSYAQNNRRDILEGNVIKIIQQFNNKLISAYLEKLELEEESTKSQNQLNKFSKQNENNQNNDSQYSVKSNQQNTETIQELRQEFDSNLTFSKNKYFDDTFLFYYIETIKQWLLAKIQNDLLIQQTEAEIYEFLTAREVSDIQDMLKNAVSNVVKNYIRESSPAQRQSFPFDKKIRSLCLLPYLSKEDIQLYFDRLTEQNLTIYLKQSQIINLMYDIAELKPDLKNTQFIYQIQNTKVYQILGQINTAYIKSRFILYVRKFMVCFQEIQFYELFRQIQPKLRYPTIRTFIRLAQTLKTEADDLHCEYNKYMNKCNYNILISIIISQNYTVQNTKLIELLELVEALNKLERSGQVLFDQICKYLRQYLSINNGQLNENQRQGLYKLFKYILSQSKPILKYQQKNGLNKQLSKKTFNLVNVLFDALLSHYPQIIIQGYRFLKGYILPEDSTVTIQEAFRNQTFKLVEKLETVEKVFTQIFDDLNVSLENVNDNNQINTFEVIQTILNCLKNQIPKYETYDQTLNKQNVTQASDKNINNLMLFRIFSQKQNIQDQIFEKLIQPLLKSYESLNMTQLSQKRIKQTYKILHKLLEIVNLIKSKSQTFNNAIEKRIQKFLENLKSKLVTEMQMKLNQYDKKMQLKRKNIVNFLDLSAPSNNKQILLCFGEIVKFYQTNINQHLNIFSIDSLKIVYNFINTICVSSIKSLQEDEILKIFKLTKNLQLMVFRQNPVLLIQLRVEIYVYLYYTLSIFIAHASDRGKYFLKFNSRDVDQFLEITQQFVNKKHIFKQLSSKKKLIPIQLILAHLIKKKYLKLNNKHLKRSEHSHILLSFMQIFGCTQNITVNLKKVIEEIQFTSNELQQFPIAILQSFSQINYSICNYLQDNKINLTSPKKLNKMTTEQLKNEFKQQKIYQMIIRNHKFSLPFPLPQPNEKMDKNTKLMYITERIYQKINDKNDYNITKNIKQLRKNKMKIIQSDDQNKFYENNQLIAEQTFLDESKASESTEQISLDTTISSQTNSNKVDSKLFYSKSFNSIDLQNDIDYIKKQSLVNYTYEEHYKLNENKLPIHYKKQTWKAIYTIPKQNEIQSLEIDQKIDQNVYKMLILSLLGYVQKVKMIAKEFHAHNFIQFIAAQLDMQVFIHGCVAKVSRKNKPDQNVIFVCSSEHNYKLLYVCTHILRESGENAYIVTQKIKQSEFKEFLQKVLPQAFENQQQDLVDKVGVSSDLENQDEDKM